MKVGLLIFSVLFPNLCLGKYLLVKTEDDDSEPEKKIEDPNDETLMLENDYHDVENKEDKVLDSRGPFYQVQNRGFSLPCVFRCHG